MLPGLLKSSLLTAFGAGLFLTLVQSIEILPLIQAGENLQLRHGATVLAGGEHLHHPDTAEPAAAADLRLMGNLFSNLLVTWGFALLLQAAMGAHHLYSRKPALQLADSLLWGAAGFWVFFFAPSLHLPPQTPVKDLLDAGSHHGISYYQQLWVVIVLSSAAGIAWLYYGKRALKRAGVVLLLAPHLILQVRERIEPTLPVHPVDQALVDSLESQFLFATTLSNLLYWMVLAALSITLVQRLPSFRRSA